jgi:clan AA aspartic protease
MLEGYVDASRQPVVTVTLVGREAQLLEVEVLIDTGFDGSLGLPTTFAEQVELQVWGTQLVELADGSRHEEWVYLGEVIFDGERHPVDISLTQGTDGLLGTAVLQGYRLVGRLPEPLGQTFQRGGRMISLLSLLFPFRLS